MMGFVADPLHEVPPPGSWWTTNNLREAIPGVPTALTWSVWREGNRRSTAAMIVRLGLATAAEAERIVMTTTSIVFGRPAANVAVTLSLMTRMQGDPEGFVEAAFGLPRGAVAYEALPPLGPQEAERAAATAIATAASQVATTRQVADQVHAKWLQLFDEPPTPESAYESLCRGAELFTTSYTEHLIMSSLAFNVYSELTALAAKAGLPGFERSLATGYGELEETDLARDLRTLGAGGSSIEEFLRRHGFHGPNEGELSSPAWRETSESVLAIAAAHHRNAGEDPLLRVTQQAAERERAEKQILDALAPTERDEARTLLDRARAWIPAREIGKAAFLKALDIVRAAARIHGNTLAVRGVLDEPDQVFHFTVDELGRLPQTGATEIAQRRAAQRADYQTTDVPAVFEGLPQRLKLDEPTTATDVITGIPVSPGQVTGTARIITDPLDAEPVNPGEILVCQTTDPSWVALFLDAAALVIDVGQTMSHGAIIARELGIPCVIDTKTGTRLIPDGAHIDVDGDAGTVRIIS